MQCHLEFWQYYFKYTKNCLCIVFSFIFDIAHISVCSTGAMAHADVSAVDIKLSSFFVVVQGQNGFVQHPHILCQSGGRGFFDIEFLSILFDMCFHITIFDVQFLLTE